MLSKNKIKYIQSLKLKKFRQKYNNFIVEGDKIARELLVHPNFEIESIFTTQTWQTKNKLVLQKHINKTIIVDEKELKKITGLSTPNEVLIIAKQFKFEIQENLFFDDFSLYLDDIRDPGNMGTILRIADWFGVKQVICSPNSVEVYNAKVVQATMGSFLRVATPIMDCIELKSKYPAIKIFGAILEGDNIFQIKTNLKGILVIGNESKGIQKNILNIMDHGLKIPKSPIGGAESLNAGVATGIMVAYFRNNI